MNPFQTREKLKRYRFRPENFTQEEARELERFSKLYGFVQENQPLEETSSNKQSNMLSQFSSGFTEGLLGPIAMGWLG